MESANFDIPKQQEDGELVDIENDLPFFTALTDVISEHTHLTRASLLSTLMMAVAGVAMYEEGCAEFVEKSFIQYCALGKIALKDRKHVKE